MVTLDWTGKIQGYDVTASIDIEMERRSVNECEPDEFVVTDIGYIDVTELIDPIGNCMPTDVDIISVEDLQDAIYSDADNLQHKYYAQLNYDRVTP